MAEPTLTDLDARLRAVEAKLGITTPSPSTPVPPTPPAPGARPFFGKADWLWAPIPAGPRLHSASARIAADLTPGDHVLNTIAYGVTIRQATGASERVMVKFGQKWGSNPHNGQPMPLPGGSVPLAPGGDKHVAILDPTAGKVWSLWAASNGGRAAEWGSVVPIDGDGTEPPPMTSTGSRISRLACVITEAELLAGEIPHALFFSSSKVGAGFVYPAGKTDQGGAEPLQEGMRLQLDPTWDVEGSGLPRYAKTIARCLQRYGAYCGDGGGATVAVIAEFTGTSATPGYRSVGITGDWSSLNGIPWARMRTLASWTGT
jgi:hypothetical protein